VNKVL